MRKKILVFMLAVLVLFGATFCAGFFRLGFSMNEAVVAEQVQVKAVLQENGDILIEETSTFRYKNRGRDWWNFYRTFGWEEIDAIRDVSVYDHDSGTNYAFTNTYAPTTTPDYKTPYNTCYLVEGLPGVASMRERGADDDTIAAYIEEMGELGSTKPYWEIGFNFPPLEKGRRTFTLRYTLSGVKQIEKYSDADVLYFKFVQEDTYPINAFSMELAFPNAGGAQELAAWLHCEAPGSFTIQDDTHISLEASHIPGTEFLELRLLMPAGSLQSAPQQHARPIRQEITEEEEAWAAAWFSAERYVLFVAAASLIAGICIFLLAGGISHLQDTSDDKSLAKSENPDYERQVPYPVSPAVAGRLMSYAAREPSKKDITIVASTLNLVQKGWLLMEYAPSRKGNQALWLAPAQGHAPMAEEEQVLYKLYGTVAESFGGRFSMAQYKAYAKNYYALVQKGLGDYFKQTEKAFRRQNWGIRHEFFSSLCAWLGLGYLGGAAVLAFGFNFFGRSMFIIGLLLGAGVLFLQAFGRARLTAAGRVAYRRWQGFRRYLIDYSLLEEREPQELALWGDYLVYGTALGIGQKTLASLSSLVPKNPEALAEAALKQPEEEGAKRQAATQGQGQAEWAGLHFAASPYIENSTSSKGGGGSSVFAAMGSNFAGIFSDIYSVARRWALPTPPAPGLPASVSRAEDIPAVAVVAVAAAAAEGAAEAGATAPGSGKAGAPRPSHACYGLPGRNAENACGRAVPSPLMFRGRISIFCIFCA